MEKVCRKEREKLAKKNDILEAALKLFAEKSFHEVTVDEIADRVGLSKGTLYLYFKNKDDLFVSIIQEKTQIFYNHLEAAVLCEKPFIDCLTRFVSTYLSFFQEHEPYFKILHSEKSRMSMDEHYRLHNWAKQSFQIFSEMTNKLMNYGKQQGVVRDIDTAPMAKALQGILNSFTFTNIFYQNEIPLEQYTQQIVDLFLHGVAGP